MSDMRFLAYGRTSFRERARFGSWGAIPDDALSDVENLRVASPAFGCGVLPCGSFLIWQELSAGGRSHGYPDVLLLDIGAALAQPPRSGHSAALLHQLFCGDGEGRRILSDIEQITTGEILGIVEAAAVPVEKSAEPDEHAAEIIAALLADTCSGSGVLAVKPEDAGLSAVPGMDLMAGAQERLPLGLRNGIGWAVNVREKYAEALGVRLAFHCSASGDPAEITAALERGRAILRALARLPGLPGRELVEPDFGRALWLDPGLCGASVRRLLALEAAADGSTAAIRAELKTMQPGAEFDRWAHFLVNAACARPAVEEGDSRFLFELALDGRVGLGTDITRRLALDTLSALLRERGILPHEIPDSLQLTEDSQERLTRAAISRSDVKVEQFLDAAEHNPPRRKSMLLNRAMKQVKEQGQPLSKLQKYAVELEPALVEAARERMRSCAPGWIQDYVTYGDDPDLQYMAETCAGHPEMAEQIVDQLLEANQTELIARIASTSIRDQLGITTKTRIIEKYRIHPAWAAMAELHDLFYGSRDKCSQPTPPPKEQEHLLKDLSRLLKTAASGSSAHAPRLDEMCRLLSDFPPPIREQLRQLAPVPRDEEEAMSWLDGWRILDKAMMDAETDRILRVWAASGRARPIPLSFFSTRKAAGLALFGWLTGGSNRQQRGVFESIVAAVVPEWTKYPQFAEITAGFPDEWRPAEVAAFLEQVDRLGPSGEFLMSKLPERQRRAVSGMRLRNALITAVPGSAAKIREMLEGRGAELQAIVEELSHDQAGARSAAWMDRITGEPSLELFRVLMEAADARTASSLADMAWRSEPDRLLAFLREHSALKPLAELIKTETAVHWIAIEALRPRSDGVAQDVISAAEGQTLFKRLFKK